MPCRSPTSVASRRPTRDEPVGGGWITFAGVMIIVVSILNIIDGIAASRTPSSSSPTRRRSSATSTRGAGSCSRSAWSRCSSAFGTWAAHQFARWTGIVIVALNMIVQLLFMAAYPFWSVAIFTIDVLILYGLAAYRGRPRFAWSTTADRGGARRRRRP